MSIEDKIKNVKGSFAMEGIEMTKTDEMNANEIISKKRDVEEIISELKRKYSVAGSSL
ncbi:hypothetical protein [Synergistes jonesii]|uniref:hypothetical protein n=1 Tax=Synergistes jonesii TaxID=2754 RepID=UPI001361FE2D|nr:hypothetical protein [Synergistes jonesii]MDY2985225.1 hypothetical protein [Synergistes jonesii]